VKPDFINEPRQVDPPGHRLARAAGINHAAHGKIIESFTGDCNGKIPIFKFVESPHVLLE
jgi:hypothetical protein